MYAQAAKDNPDGTNPPPGGDSGPSSGGGKDDDDIVDADFEEVK